uniref:DUF148 domain-containing protein n=1 Tax=Rhabditophanes sp. KR3021 TaxID=114890 RepID=A0AC35TM58_9BILA
MQLKFVILVLTLVAVPTLAFPMGNGEDLGPNADLKYCPYDLVEKLSTAAREGVEIIFKNADQTKAAISDALEILFTGPNVTEEDKTIYAAYKTEKANKESKIIAKIEAGIASSPLTDSQKALFASAKTIFENQNISIKQAEADIENVKNSASEEDRNAVEKAIISALSN